MARSPRTSARRESGLTLIETLVTLAVLTVVMLGLYALLDSSNALAKQETNVAEAQQSVRIGISELTRVIRQARVGGLFIGNAILPIENNSPGGSKYPEIVKAGFPAVDHYVRKGTDVIEVRGIIQGDKYGLSTGDVICGGSCATTNSMTVTIRSTSSVGVVNFPSGGAPSIAGKTVPFFFVVADSSLEKVTIGADEFLVPVYYIGLVNPNSFDLKTDTFTFVMDPSNAEARKLDAVTPSATTLDKPFSGGVVDNIRFFVDEGPTNQTGSALDTHPSLAEATFDPFSKRWEIQPLIEEVEDFQVAYGVDGINTGVHDKGVSPTVYITTGPGDEWVGNAAGEVEALTPTTTDPIRVEKFIDSSAVTGATGPQPATAALRSVMFGLVVKSADPDLRYNGPGARGFNLLDSPMLNSNSFSDATGRPYRRRLQRFAVSLRNYQ